jgi:hypothetical protein
VLQFSPPSDTRNVTHYRIYNAQGQLFATIPHTNLQASRTFKLANYDQTIAFLSSYDSRTDLESYQTRLQGSIATSTPTAVIDITEYTLTVATTAITALGAGGAGDEKLVIITTDATDGRLITWDATFKGVTTDDIDNRANTTNIYRFVKRGDGNWWLTSRIHYQA